MKVITICNQKGGVGKTTFAFHLAEFLGGMGRDIVFYTTKTGRDNKKYRDFAFKYPLLNKRVLYIDADPQQNSTFLLGERAFVAPITTFDFLTKRCSLDAKHQGITLLKADDRLKDTHLFNAVTTTNVLLQNLADCRNNYDYVIIDTPPTENIIIRCLFVASNYIISPIVPVTFSIQGIVGMLKLVFGVKQIVRAEFSRDLEFLGMVPCKILGQVGKIDTDASEVKGLKMHENALRELITGEYAGLMLLNEAKKCVGISERQIVEIAVSNREPVWEQTGTDALASTRDFLGVFEAVAHKIGGF